MVAVCGPPVVWPTRAALLRVRVYQGVRPPRGAQRIMGRPSPAYVRRAVRQPLRKTTAAAAAAAAAATAAGDGAGGERRGVDVGAFLRQLIEFWDIDKVVADHGASLQGNSKEGEADGTAKSGNGQLRVVLGRLATLAAPDGGVLVAAFALLLCASLAELGIPYLVSTCLVSASQGDAGRAAFTLSVQRLGILALVYGLFSGARGYAFSICNQRMVRRLRDGAYRALITQSMGWLDTQNIGELTSRLNSDSNTVANTLGLNVNILLRNALQVIGGGTLLVTLSPQLAGLTAMVATVYLGLANVYGRYTRRLAATVQDAIASTNQVAEETLTRAAVVRVFGAERREVHRYTERSAAVYDLRLRWAAAWGLFHGSSSAIFNSTKAIALLVGGTMLAAGATTAAQLTTFVLYVDMVVGASLAVCEQWAQILEAVGASERVMALLARPQAPQMDAGLTLPLSMVHGAVTFKDVHFAYPARPEVQALAGFSMTLEAGKVTAFVGSSGSGKSTVAKLVQRLYDPDAGEVTLDGRSLRDLDSAWFRSLLGVVSQEAKLFPADVAANISYGRPDATQAAVEAAARLANAHDFILTLPDGYATPVGEGRLSGGQQQRIAIARALVCKPRLLVLDEATSALDARSEAVVQAALDTIIHAKWDDPAQRPPTVLVIAHRLATVQRADKIVVMDAGRVIEQGTHAQLLELGGAYAMAWNQQKSMNLVQHGVDDGCVVDIQ